MAKKLIYYITLHQKHVQSDSENVYIERIVKSPEIAKELMESIYEDAKNESLGKHGTKYSDPKWLNESHTKIQVTTDININGWLHCTHIQTYELHDDWNTNLYSDKPWVLD